MNPVVNSPCLMGEYSDSSDVEELPPTPPTLSADLNSSCDSISWADLTSSADTTAEDDLVVLSPSSSPARTIDLTSPTPPTSPFLPTIADPSTSSMPETYPEQMSPVPSTSRGIQENSDDFRFEAARRSSFKNWSVSFSDPGSLAAAGLYHTGYKNIVKCFVCPLTLENNHWLEGHTPMQIHRMYSPECRFICNEHCDNVPIGADPDKVLRKKRRNRNISCPYGLFYHDSFNFNEHRFLKYLRKPTAYELSRLGLKIVKKADNLSYASYESRLASFATRPSYMAQTSEKLAEAGFYYEGINDFTTCYHCGIGMGHWKVEEDPWEQHAISSPNCPYVLTVRGSEFVNNVTGQELYETCTEAPIQATVDNHEGFDNENDIKEMSLAEKVAALEKENRALKDSLLCKVCMQREATITFAPCGHLATCDYCSPAFSQCIICRRKIKAVINTFIT